MGSPALQLSSTRTTSRHSERKLRATFAQRWDRDPDGIVFRAYRGLEFGVRQNRTLWVRFSALCAMLPLQKSLCNVLLGAADNQAQVFRLYSKVLQAFDVTEVQIYAQMIIESTNKERPS